MSEYPDKCRDTCPDTGNVTPKPKKSGHAPKPTPKPSRARQGLTLRHVRNVRIRLDEGPYVKEGLA